MEELKIDIARVGELASLLNQKTITKDRFRFDMTAYEALQLLAWAYKTEVELRLRTVVFDENTTENLKSLARYITQPTPKFGVMLCGTCGNGKTTLMYAFRRVVNLLNDGGHFAFLSPNFKVEMRIVDTRELTQMAKNDKRYKEYQNLVMNSMLGIDDLGKEPTEVMRYGNIESPVVELVEQRYSRQLFTFITTNLTKAQIRDKYGDRIADRFNEMLETIIHKSISYRSL